MECLKDRNLDSDLVPHLDYWSVALAMDLMTMVLMTALVLVWPTDHKKDIYSDSNLVILLDSWNEA